MRILYSTLTHCYLRDGDDEKVIDRGRKPNMDCVYGIAKYNDRYVLAKRDGQEAKDPTHLLFLDKAGVVTDRIEIPKCRGAHQICVIDDLVLTTASVTNEIFITDVHSGESVGVRCDFGRPGGKDDDVNHVNSLWRHHEGLYVYCHNHGQSFIAVIDLQRLIIDHEIKVWRVYDNVGVKGHNVLVDGNDMFSLSSGQGRMVCQKRDSGEIYKSVSLEGRYLRGLVKHGGKLYAGGSHRGARSERSKPREIAIFAIDRESLEVEDAIKIKDRANILDILIGECDD